MIIIIIFSVQYSSHNMVYAWEEMFVQILHHLLWNVLETLR